MCDLRRKNGHTTFRSKIELAYNTIKKQQEEKEAQDLLQPSHLRAMDTVAIVAVPALPENHFPSNYQVYFYRKE